MSDQPESLQQPAAEQQQQQLFEQLEQHLERDANVARATSPGAGPADDSATLLAAALDSDQDLDIEIVENEKDSGMSSLGGSKDETPERRVIIEDIQDDDEEGQAVVPAGGADGGRRANGDNYDEEPDETLAERLWGLTEMFPDSVRTVCGSVTDLSVRSVKSVYQFSCSASWIVFTSSMLLFAPVIFEMERAQVEEMQRSQQKQVLLGPGSAMGHGGLPALPPMTGGQA